MADRNSDWLYHHETLAWLRRPELRRQLPLLLRFYAYFCILQRSLGRFYVIRGRWLFEKISAIRRFFARPDSVRLVVGQHIAHLNLNDPRMLQVPNELIHDSPDIECLRRFVHTGDTFLDVGATHGSFSIRAAPIVGVKGLVVAVEPQPRMAALLEQSLREINGLNYKGHPIACGEKDATITFYIPRGSSGSAGRFAAYSAQTAHTEVEVPMKRFDDAVDWRTFPGEVFLKLDIEGSELAFLTGAATFLNTRRPRILMEVSPATLSGAGLTIGQLIAPLLASGYRSFIEIDQPENERPLDTLDAIRHRNVVLLP